MKRKGSQERDEADAREQADSRREKLLAELKAREEAGRQVPLPPPLEDPPVEDEPAEDEPADGDPGPADQDSDDPPKGEAG